MSNVSKHQMTKCRIGDYIKDVASGPFGANLKVECFVPTGFPIIDGANLTGLRVSDNITKFVTEEKARSLSRSIAKRHDVIVTISGTLGQVSYIPDDSKYKEYLCSQRQFRVTFDETKINVEYLVNLLRTPYGQRKILAFANYVGVPALAQPIPNFKNIELYLPDLPMQLRIAGVLGSIDEKIELNRKKIAELEALAKTIYDYWFVQFDFPDAHGNPYKSSGGKMVWNEQLKREVPEGWEVKELGGIATFANGINYTNADQCGKTYRIVNVRDISASTIYIHEDGLSEVTLPETLADRYLIPDNSIIIARSGCPGAIRLLSNGGNIIFCGFIIVCKPKLMSSRIYLMFCLKSLEGSSVTHKDSSILNNVSQDMLKRVVLAIPDVMVLQKFNDILSPILKRITTLQGETSQVIKLRDMLLPILMNGQAKVESSK